MRLVHSCLSGLMLFAISGLPALAATRAPIPAAAPLAISTIDQQGNQSNYQQNDVATLYQRGEDDYKAGRYEEAMEKYKQIIRLRSDAVTAYYNLGLSYYNLKRYQDAIDAYKEEIRLKPDYASAYLFLGNSLDYAGRYNEALAAYKEAIRLQPSEAQPHYELAVA